MYDRNIFTKGYEMYVIKNENNEIMNKALELANEFRKENNNWNEDNLRHWGKQTATMLRILDGQLAFRIDAVTKYQAKVKEQQAEIKALKAENSHLKYEISSGAWNPAELTDEEKWEVFTNLARSPDLRADMIRFADSILRKAQE
jgi:hypothetical protein